MITSQPHTRLKQYIVVAGRYLTLVFLTIFALSITQSITASAATQEESLKAALQDSIVTPTPTPLPPPEPPELLAPEDNLFATGGTVPPLGIPRLVWSAENEAERYRVQISETNNFANPIVNETTYMNSYTPEIALADGSYYWRVQLEVERLVGPYRKEKVWGPFSETRSFTKDWTDDGRIIPELLMPAHESELAVFVPNNFTWTPIAGAAIYLFEISSNENFNSIEYSAETVKPHHTPIQRLPNNTYFWRVTPIDRQGNVGDLSQVSTFQFNWDFAPDLLAPLDGIEQPFITPFSWTAVEAADTYVLELSTDPDFSAPQQYATHQTKWTPEKGLANDQEYYWRVQALDNVGNSGPWSLVRQFRMRWDFQAELLAPVNNNSFLSYPVLQWSPIPGAERYQVQVDEGTSFDDPIADIETYNVTANTLTQSRDLEVAFGQDRYWRVRGIDAQDNYTSWSRVSTFRYSETFGPNLIYPRYYYAPDSENLPQYLDHSVGWPVFVWDAANNVRTDGKWGTTAPDYYELTVASDPAFTTIHFQIETAGQAAVPTLDNRFANFVSDQIYYWRIRAYRDGQQQGTDMIWITRMDDEIRANAETDELTILYPEDRFEAVETAPVLGWHPVRNADHYRVQLSDSATFENGSILEDERPTSPNYAPWQGRQVGGLHQTIPTGLYWWRVQAEDAQNNPIGAWTSPRRFHISHNLVNGNRYDLIPPLYPASIISETARFDPAIAHVGTNLSPASDQYKVDNLHVMLNRIDLKFTGLSMNEPPSSYDWLISFEIADTVADTVLYGIYFDVNHIEGDGATVDPLGKPIDVDPLYLPDYAVYVTRSGNNFSANDTQLFRWSGSNWAPAQTLASIRGDVWFDASNSAVQILLPYTSIGAGDVDFTGSMALAAFSTSTDNQEGVLDIVPTQGNVIDSPVWVSDMPMPFAPFDSPLSNSTVHLQMPTMYWRLESYDSIDGYEIQIAHDQEFTDIVETASIYERQEASSYSWIPAAFQSEHAFNDNESYYWRVRARHEHFDQRDRFAFDYSPWSMPMRFTLDSQLVENASLSTGTNATTTPSFSWDRLEGVSGYTIQVDTSADFNRPLIDEKVDGISFTPTDALADNTYYWRLAMRRSDKVVGRWTETMTFTKRAETPLLVSPLGGVEIDEQPTFQWDSLLMPETEPKMATPRYQLQVANSPDFNGVGFDAPKYFKVDSTSYTPNERESMPDGDWYWRVALLDAKRQVGAYSPTQHFTKQYPAPTLITPPGHNFVPGTVNFSWQPIQGAAYYELQYDDSPIFESPGRITTDSVQATPTKNLPFGIYYWRVRMVDSDRNPGPYADSQISVYQTSIHLPMMIE